MENYYVNDESELGNAIWSANNGDTITLKGGRYGNIVLKKGVSYKFEDGASASKIIGLDHIGRRAWSASEVKIGNAILVNPKIDIENIGTYYIFSKFLPFNSRFESPIEFAHANGVLIRVIGNDKEGFSIGSNASAESQLPKAVVQIIVPILDKFNPKLADDDGEMVKAVLEEKPLKERKLIEEKYEKEKLKKKSIENYAINESVGLHLTDPEYRALWALNSFIREHERVTNGDKIKGFSILEFRDELNYTVTNSLDVASPYQLVLTLGKFSNIPFTPDQTYGLAESLLSVQEFSISDFNEYHLNLLNYSIATVGMYQEFEVLWEQYSPDKQDKWGFITSVTTEPQILKGLSEMINARNNIIHSGKLNTKHKDRNKLKSEWGAEELNEFEIFWKKKPWYWNKALREFIGLNT